MELRGRGRSDQFENLLAEGEPLRGPGAVRALVPLVPGVAAAAAAFLLATRLGLDHPALVLVAAVVVATAFRTRAGFAATIAGAALFAFGGSGEDVFDTLLFIAVASAVPVLAGRSRREQARLTRSDHRYRMLVEELPVGLYLDLPDTSATNVYSNPEIVRMLGYPPETWVGDAEFSPRSCTRPIVSGCSRIWGGRSPTAAASTSSTVCAMSPVDIDGSSTAEP